MDSTSANEDSDNMSESPSNTTPITKSQRIPKPKINADFLYGDDMRKPSRKSTAKRKFIEDEDSLNGVENRTPEIKQKKRSSYTSPNNNTVMEGKRVAINGEAKLIRTVGMESRSSLRSPIVIKSLSNIVSASDPRPIPLTVNGKKLGRPRTRPYRPKGEDLDDGIFTESTVNKESVKNGLSDSRLNGSSQMDDTINSTFIDDNEVFVGEDLVRTSSGKLKKPTLMTYIIRALSEHPDGMSGLPDIYEYIRNSSERYRHLKTEWRSSVRNCLSSSPRFKKFPRPIDMPHQRGVLWGLNPDNPSNASLINHPKDASKFLPREDSIPRVQKSHLYHPSHSESPMGSLSGGENSNMSSEELYIRKSSYSRLQQHPIRIVVNPLMSTPSTSQSPFLENANQDHIPIEYVYYYSGTAPINSQHSEPSTPSGQTISNGTTNYSGYAYEEMTPISQQDGFFTFNYEEYDQENWLPKPLMPKKVDESEFTTSTNNPVYMQL